MLKAFRRFFSLKKLLTLLHARPQAGLWNDTGFILKGSKDTDTHTHSMINSFDITRKKADKVLCEYMDKWCTQTMPSM